MVNVALNVSPTKAVFKVSVSTQVVPVRPLSHVTKNVSIQNPTPLTVGSVTTLVRPMKIASQEAASQKAAPKTNPKNVEAFVQMSSQIQVTVADVIRVAKKVSYAFVANASSNVHPTSPCDVAINVSIQTRTTSTVVNAGMFVLQDTAARLAPAKNSIAL